MEYISALEASLRWKISRRRVLTLCKEGRIPEAQKVGASWIIPADAEKPADARFKNNPKEVNINVNSNKH